MVPETPHPIPTRKAPRVSILPATTLGGWAVGLALAGVVGVLTWSVLPLGASLGFACGLAGGVVGLIAIVRRGERAVSVFLALLPFAFVVLFVLAELIIGHE